MNPLGFAFPPAFNTVANIRVIVVCLSQIYCRPESIGCSSSTVPDSKMMANFMYQSMDNKWWCCLINMKMDLEVFDDIFQSSTPMERKCENSNITSHIILTSHGTKGSQGWSWTLGCFSYHPCIFWCTSLKWVTEEGVVQALGTKVSRT